MHQSANDILSITTNRETLLIGPCGAFGVIHKDDILHGRAEIENAIDRVLSEPGIEHTLRANTRRLGLEPAALKRLDHSGFRRWLTGQAVRGAVGVCLVPDPEIAFSAHVHRQEHAVAQAASLLKILESDDEALPRDVESRFLLILDMVPDHLSDEAKKRFNDIIADVGIEMIAVGLLVWLGAHMVPGLNLVVLAFDLYFLSGEVLRAMETVAECILLVQKATKRTELEEISKILAGAIAVLVIQGVLRKFLRAKKTTRGQTKPGGSGRDRFKKPSAKKTPPRQKPKADAGKPKAEADKPKSDAEAASPDAKKATPGATPAARAKFASGIDDGTKRALDDFDTMDAGKVSRDLDGKKIDDVKKYMADNYPDVKPEVNPNMKPVDGEVGKRVQTKWELPDGTVVRVKETDPIGGKADDWRREPTISVGVVKRDATGKPMPETYANEAFKVAPDGTPVPKGPKDVNTDGLSDADAKKAVDAVMNAGHRELER